MNGLTKDHTPNLHHHPLTTHWSYYLPSCIVSKKAKLFAHSRMHGLLCFHLRNNSHPQQQAQHLITLQQYHATQIIPCLYHRRFSQYVVPFHTIGLTPCTSPMSSDCSYLPTPYQINLSCHPYSYPHLPLLPHQQPPPHYPLSLCLYPLFAHAVNAAPCTPAFAAAPSSPYA